MAKLLGGTTIYGNATVNSYLIVGGNAALGGGNVTVGTGSSSIANIGMITTGNLYTTYATVTISAPTLSPGATALANAYLGAVSANVSNFGTGSGYQLGQTLTMVGNGTAISNATFTVTTVNYAGAVLGLNVVTTGNYIFANSNPVTFTGGTGTGANAVVYYGVGQPFIIYSGVGYTELPTVTISGGGGGTGASAYAVFTGNSRIASMGNLLSFYTPAGEGMRMGVTGNLQLFGNINSNSSAISQALLVPGGAGIGGNVYVGGRVGYTWASNSYSAAYTYYNQATNSVDIVFGG